MEEGSIHILKLSKATDPKPWTYAVTFTPNTVGAAALSSRDVVGDDALVKLLRDEIGIDKALVDDIVKAAGSGATTVPRVRLTTDERKALGL